MSANDTKWDICWHLKIKRPEALKMLYSFIVTPNEIQTRKKKYQGQIHGSSFEIWIKTSLLWTSAFNTRIKGHGSLSDYKWITKLTANFKICFPYDFAKLSSKTASILVCTFILSWLGFLATEMIDQISNWLLVLFLPSGLISSIILYAAFLKFQVIHVTKREVGAKDFFHEAKDLLDKGMPDEVIMRAKYIEPHLHEIKAQLRNTKPEVVHD